MGSALVRINQDAVSNREKIHQPFLDTPHRIFHLAKMSRIREKQGSIASLGRSHSGGEGRSDGDHAEKGGKGKREAHVVCFVRLASMCFDATRLLNRAGDTPRRKSWPPGATLWQTFTIKRV
jgi:hypothetical protein